MLNRKSGYKPASRAKGFSLIELMIVAGVLTLLMALAVPRVLSISQGYAVSGDARTISAQLDLARMRASANYSHARLYANLSTNTFHVEMWNKAGGTGGCWQTFGDNNACTQASSPVTSLAAGDTFGFGTISTSPTTATNPIAQAAACQAGSANNPGGGSAVANTACIEFSSRGFPVDNTGAVVANDAVYVRAGQSNNCAAVVVPVAGQPAMYGYSGSSWTSY
jgi:prepilin-type N-terminal cleavage/methylation domain-containing protein